MNLLCHYFDGRSEINVPACGNLAESFVRIHSSGRLCPLCDTCKNRFIEATDYITKNQEPVLDVIEKERGGSSYSEVSMTDGFDEYKKQVPRSPEHIQKTIDLVDKMDKAAAKMKMH